MLALSREGDKVFLHQPQEGLAVPVVLNFNTQSMTVAVPSVDELEHDYAVYEDLASLMRAAGRSRRHFIDLAEQFSRECSTQFSEQISAGDVTVAGLRKLVNERYPQALFVPDAVSTPDSGSEIALASYAQAITAD